MKLVPHTVTLRRPDGSTAQHRVTALNPHVAAAVACEREGVWLNAVLGVRSGTRA